MKSSLILLGMFRIVSHFSSRPEEVCPASIVEFDSSPAKKEDDITLLAKEMADIKKALLNLDNKVSAQLSEPRSAEKPQRAPSLPEKPVENKKAKEELYRHIYPSWWTHSSANNSRKLRQKKGKWEDEEWRKKHELDCTAVAKESIKQNRIASTRRPVKMLFDKKEFSGPYIYRDLHPIIVTKKKEGVAPSMNGFSGSGSAAELAQAAIREHDEYEPPRRNESIERAGHEESVPKLVDSCAGSPIINYFSGEYRPSVRDSE